MAHQQGPQDPWRWDDNETSSSPPREVTIPNAPIKRMRLTPTERALLLVGLPLIGVIALIVLAPSLIQIPVIRSFWGELPTIALLAPIFRAAYRSPIITTIGYTCTAIIVGMVNSFIVISPNPSTATLLIFGMLVSGALLYGLLYLSIKKFAIDESRRYDQIAMAIISTVVSLVAYVVAFQHVPILIWTAPILAEIGWLFGDQVLRRIVKLRESGTSK